LLAGWEIEQTARSESAPYHNFTGLFGGHKPDGPRGHSNRMAPHYILCAIGHLGPYNGDKPTFTGYKEGIQSKDFAGRFYRF
jgi:hypothetical protein